MDDKEVMARLKKVDLHAVDMKTTLDIITYRLAGALGYTTEKNGGELMHLNMLLDEVEIKLSDLDLLMGGMSDGPFFNSDKGGK